jgi:subtilisin family serine protease
MQLTICVLVSLFLKQTLLAKEIKPLIIAVIDSGVDLTHAELEESIWTNPGEIGLDSLGRDRRTNGIDDDGNGFVDDVHGWDFVTNSGRIVDLHGHGTHIAGIIAAKGLHPKLPMAAGYGSKVMSLRYFCERQSGKENLKKSIAALRYAIENGAHVINYSGGGSVPDEDEAAILLEASKKNILVVAAAGNEARSIDRMGFYPAAYGFSNVVSIAASKATGDIIPASNFGSGTVELSAYGHNVFSTLPKGRYGQMTGTSQATALASAWALGILLKNPHLLGQPQQIIQRLSILGTHRQELENKVRTGALLDREPKSVRQGLDTDALGRAITPPLAL